VFRRSKAKSSPTLLFQRRGLKLLPLQREAGRDFAFDFAYSSAEQI